MISKKEIENLIGDLDSKIKDYSENFALKKIVFDNLTDNCAFFTYERTVAAFSTFSLASLLNDKGYVTNLIVNEFPIELKNKINMFEFDLLRSATSLKTRKTQWDKCYVDGYLQVDSIVTKDKTTQLFIEYKMENKLVLLNLACDYLKYKTYTYKSNNDTAFIYIVFKKEEDYPSIINPSYPLFELIGENLASNPIKSNTRVYIFLPNKSSQDNHNKLVEDIYPRFNLVSDLADEINTELSKQKLTITSEQMVFINNMSSFNSKVIRSMTLRKHYPFMKEVWEAAHSANLFQDLDVIFEVDKDKITPEYIINEGSTFKRNLSQIYTAEAKQSAMEHGARPSTNVSLFIVSVCDYFNEAFNLGVETPDYAFQKIKSGREVRIHEWKTTVEYFKKKLHEFYGGNNGYQSKKIVKLYYSLMFYIMNLYPIIFDISDNSISGYSKSFSEYRLIEYLQNEIDKLTKATSFKEKIDLDGVLFDENSDSKQILANFVNYIFTKY